jgi:hypothetical protein
MISCQHEPRFYSGGYQWCPKCGVFKKDSETGWNLPSQFRALCPIWIIRMLQSILNATLSEGERG